MDKLNKEIKKKMANRDLIFELYLNYYPVLLYYNFKKLAYHIFDGFENFGDIGLKIKKREEEIHFEKQLIKSFEISGILIDDDFEKILKKALNIEADSLTEPMAKRKKNN